MNKFSITVLASTGATCHYLLVPCYASRTSVTVELFVAFTGTDRFCYVTFVKFYHTFTPFQVRSPSGCEGPNALL